ncbi:MAG: CHAT domain-containing protein [Phormidesmis sp.]
MFSALAAAAIASSVASSSLLEVACDGVVAVETVAPEMATARISELLVLGDEQTKAEDDAAAIATYCQALTLIEQQENPDIGFKGETLFGLGNAYSYTEEYAVALPVLEAALEIYESFAAESAEMADLGFGELSLSASDYIDITIVLFDALGSVHYELGNFASALGYYRRGLVSDNLEVRAYFLQNIGALEAETGQYDKAEMTLQQAAELGKAVADTGLVATTTFTLGWVSERQEKYEQAIANYQRAIALYQSVEDFSREARTFNNLGMVHLNQGEVEAARQAFEQGFALLTQPDDSRERAVLLNSLGSLYRQTGELEQAWQTHVQALQLSQETGDAVGEVEVLLNLGRLMEAKQAPDLAIFFYKRAIAKIESIRQDLRQLSQDVQQRYTLTVEDFYRNLADLLLRQGRNTEALQVLELLKLQEVKAYLSSGSDQSGRGEAAAMRLSTPAEVALAQVLNDLLGDNSLATFVQHPAAIALSSLSGEPADTSDAFDLQVVEYLRAAIASQPVKTAVLYPLILENRLEIILITPTGAVEQFTVPVAKETLNQTVSEMQTALKSKALDPKPAAQQLYEWLIEPLARTLAAAKAEKIIYLPDGVLRYVPLAAFYDGQQWLAQKYQSHSITAAMVDDLSQQSSLPLSVVAGAFTDSNLVLQVEAGSQTFEYHGLSAAKQEIDNLTDTMPGTVALLNGEFTPDSTLGAAAQHQIIHLATHAKFVAGQPEASFILFGDGSAVNMRDIQQWKLPGVDLVVLSACETGSSADGEGKEILGLGFQMQQTGAASAIASLWTVDDFGTAALMNQFYDALSRGAHKAQALNQAQNDLIESDRFSHPYYWAAFILIGNGQ